MQLFVDGADPGRQLAANRARGPVGLDFSPEALRFCRLRKLDHGGRVILNLPAYRFLMSTHDRAIHPRHRYRRRELREKVTQAGLVIETLSYRNTALFPVAVIGPARSALASSHPPLAPM